MAYVSYSLRSNDIEQIVNAGEYILESWKGYSDPSVNIFAFTNDVPHNTITPIARYRNNMYELDLVYGTIIQVRNIHWVFSTRMRKYNILKRKISV